MDFKIISEALASRVKKVLLNQISPQKTAYVENRSIGKSSRLIGDVTEITDVLNKERFLVTMDIEKVFDSFLYLKKLVLVTVLWVGLKS